MQRSSSLDIIVPEIEACMFPYIADEITGCLIDRNKLRKMRGRGSLVERICIDSWASARRDISTRSNLISPSILMTLCMCGGFFFYSRDLELTGFLSQMFLWLWVYFEGFLTF